MTTERANQIATKAVAEMTRPEVVAEQMADLEISKEEYLVQTRDGDGRFDLSDWLAGTDAMGDAADELDADDGAWDLIEEAARQILSDLISAEQMGILPCLHTECEACPHYADGSGVCCL